MGYLNHSSNNILLDAVLTDKGREALARNDGSFAIVKFALGDDDVDYTVIEKFGRTVGKEKIEKNTPVLEALTNQNQALKYKLVSVSNPNLIRLPSISLTGEGYTSSTNVVTMGRTITRRRSLTVSQTITDESTIDVELRDQTFEVELNNDFLRIEGGTPDIIDTRKQARYLLSRDRVETAVGGSKLTFTLELRNITDEQFTTYGNVSDKTTIQTYVKVRGLQSGAVKEFTISITNTG